MRATFLLLLGLPLAHAGPRPVLALSGAHVDRCGVARGTLETRAKGRDREATVLVDGVPHAVVVPQRAETTPFAVPTGPWAPHVAVAASWRFVDTDPVVLARPPWDLGLLVTPPHDPAQGEVPPLEVAVTGGCDVSGLALRAEADGRLLHHGAVGPVPLPLVQGRHALTLTLLDGTHEVAREALVLDVGPPCIDLDGDGFPQCHRRDCDDTDPAIHPGATDVIGNGIDDDCDGVNGQDSDRDGFEDAAVGGDDCDDRQALVFPGALRFPDADGDGASPFERVDFDCDGVVDARPGPYDCDDTDPTVPRKEAPVPTGVDEDCDGLVDEGTVAFDDDGDGRSEEQGDCDDTDVRVHPGARETADCRDEDCDGVIDDGVTRPETDDRYEPNDVEAAEIPGARYQSGWFGGRYVPSEATVRAVTRDLDDVERYSVYAHDGDFDTFHVTVRVSTIGDARAYAVRISGGFGTAEGVVDGNGDGVTLGGKGARDDSGTYQIEVRPLSGELPWCPLELVVSTG